MALFLEFEYDSISYIENSLWEFPEPAFCVLIT